MQIRNGELAVLRFAGKEHKRFYETLENQSRTPGSLLFQGMCTGSFLYLLEIGNHLRQPGHPHLDLLLRSG